MLFVKKIGHWELSSEAKRSTRALPKTSQIFWTASGWSVHSPEETLFLDNMCAPWFIFPSTCIAFSERRLFWAHTRRLFSGVQSCFETRAPWWFMYETTDLLSERTSTWCPHMSGRKNWQAWRTAGISRQLMCRSDSSSDQRQKVGLPLHSAPQPLLEASVMTTFLLCAVSKITPCFSQRRSLHWARADTQARVTITRCVRDAKPWMEPSASARTEWVACEAAAIMPSILWKALRGRAVPSSKEAACGLIVVARSAETVAVICTESITVHRNENRWLGDSMLLAKLTLSPRQHKWLRRRRLAMADCIAIG